MLGVSQVAGLAGIVVILAIQGQPFPADANLLWSVAAGGASIVALGSIYFAAARGPIIVVAPVAALGAAVPVGLSILRGDQLSAVAVAGIAAALCGVTIAGWQTGQGRHVSGGCLGPIMALVSALAFGVFLISLDLASRPSPYWATAVMRASSCALILGYLAVRRPRVSALLAVGPLGLLMIAAVGLTDMGAEVSFATASQTGELGIIAVLASLYPAVTVALAILVLRDRTNWLQISGAVVTTIGAALLAGAHP